MAVQKTEFKLVKHLLQPVQVCLSPHQQERLAGEISLIVLHSISLPHGSYGTDYVRQLFMGELNSNADPSFADLEGLRVSAHLFIRRGGKVVQFVPFDKVAWHAGKSFYQDKGECNDFSIGIELEGGRDDSYQDEQYKVLADLCRTLLAFYVGLDASRIVGHKDIAPGRKDDPWNFDQDRFIKQLLAG